MVTGRELTAGRAGLGGNPAELLCEGVGGVALGVVAHEYSGASRRAAVRDYGHGEGALDEAVRDGLRESGPAAGVAHLDRGGLRLHLRVVEDRRSEVPHLRAVGHEEESAVAAGVLKLAMRVI